MTSSLPAKRAPSCANAPYGTSRTRTCDPLHVKKMLSQLSYGPISIRCSTNHRIAFAMKKSVVGNTTEVALIL